MDIPWERVARLRYWVVDNAGELARSSKHQKVVKGPAGTEGVAPASRWEECGDALRWHGAATARLHAPTQFRFAEKTVSTGYGDVDPETDGVDAAVASTSTPPPCTLARQLRDVAAELRSREASLRGSSRVAVVAACTRGRADIFFSERKSYFGRRLCE